jgi:hypothetical protein
VSGVLRVGGTGSRDPAALPWGFEEVSGRHRPLHGHVGAARVQVRPTEVVVGVPRVGGQRQHDPGGRRWPEDEEGVVASDLLSHVDLHHHLVVTRPPRPVDVQCEGHRPATALGGGLLRRLVLVGRHGGRAEDDFPASTQPGYLDVHRAPRGGRNVQAHLLPRAYGLGPAVTRHHLTCHGRILGVGPKRPPGAGPSRGTNGWLLSRRRLAPAAGPTT